MANQQDNQRPDREKTRQGSSTDRGQGSSETSRGSEKSPSRSEEIGRDEDETLANDGRDSSVSRESRQDSKKPF